MDHLDDVRLDRRTFLGLAAAAAGITLGACGSTDNETATGTSAPPAAAAAEPEAMTLDAARARVDELMTEGLSRSQAARLAAAESGQPRRELFREAPDVASSATVKRHTERFG